MLLATLLCAALHLQTIVAHAVQPVMARYGIPGMAVGVVVNGETHVYNFGATSKATGKPVDDDTLFEIGSVTKTFNATLAAYAQLTGKLSLTDMAGADFPALRGSSFDRVPLVDLGTYTAGGLPLQFPDDITTDAQAFEYYRQWKPAYAPGTHRLYSNPSIMLLGRITATHMHGDFATLVQQLIFAPLRMRHSFFAIPQAQMANYAQGYRESGAPIRMTLGPLANEAYGIRITAGDLLRFLDANMRPGESGDAMLARAMRRTRTGYFRLGPMTQDLVWEQFTYPVQLRDLLYGNSNGVLLQPNPVRRLEPPMPPSDNVLLNKTGSTNGFGAYVLMVPARKIAIVILANRSYPIAARVTAAYTILSQL